MTCRPGEASRRAAELRFPLIVKPLQSRRLGRDRPGVGGPGPRPRSPSGWRWCTSGSHQPAIAEEFIDGPRALREPASATATSSTSCRSPRWSSTSAARRPEERIATQSAKWDEDYRARKGIRNVFARPLARAARERIDEICRTAFRALWLRDYARLDVRLAPDGEVWFLEANANPFISYGHDMANAAEKAGMDYYEFIQRLVDEAMARHDHA